MGLNLDLEIFLFVPQMNRARQANLGLEGLFCRRENFGGLDSSVARRGLKRRKVFPQTLSAGECRKSLQLRRKPERLAIPLRGLALELPEAEAFFQPV